MEKDYYNILGLNNDASDDDIKKAFRKMSIKWHPDKWANASENEKKEAEEKFKEINEAYQVLSDPQKKSNYDRFGNVDGPQGFGGFGGFNPFDIFRNMGGNPFHQERGPEPGASISYKLGLTIEEIFNGCEKTIRYQRVKRCSTCNGEGGTGIKTCPHCRGTGMITKTERHGFTVIQNSSPCPYCHGKGKTVEKICSDCGGKGLKDVTETLNVKVSPGQRRGSKLNFPKMGYDSKDKNGVTGDLIVYIDYDLDSNKYAIQGNDVYELIEIPYYRAILGGKIKHKLPNGSEVEVNISKCSQHEDKIILNGYGINRGKYIFILKILLPKTIDSKTEKLLKEIENGEA